MECKWRLCCLSVSCFKLETYLTPINMKFTSIAKLLHGKVNTKWIRQTFGEDMEMLSTIQIILLNVQRHNRENLTDAGVSKRLDC